MMLTIEQKRAECVRYCVEQGHNPAHADDIVPKDEAEIRRIFVCIQKEQEKAKRYKKVPRPIAGLNIFEIVEIDPAEEATAD